jgi:hypothetical protein
MSCEKRKQELPMIDIEEMIYDNEGICLHCGEVENNIEPDAKNYKCNWCGCYTVYGTEEAIVEGYLVPYEGE